MSRTARPVLLLLGPTASGKSAVAMRLAERHPVEIVSVDSAQVYRGMDVGTAKPTAAERGAVPHHLIDIVEPTESYSAARFADDARAAIMAIRARGAVPVLVGGTMLYARALVAGLHPLPGADPALRATIEADGARAGWPALHARLAAVDPRTAARLEPTDAQRIARALEVHAASGRALSDWLDAPAPRPAGSFVVVSLEPADRGWLHARIAARFAAMIRAGLLDELRALRARGDLHSGLPSMRCVGYRQGWALLDALPVRDPELERDPAHPRLAEFVAQGIAATRQLAKRQLTWLRAMPARAAFDACDPRAGAAIEALFAQRIADGRD